MKVWGIAVLSPGWALRVSAKARCPLWMTGRLARARRAHRSDDQNLGVRTAPVELQRTQLAEIVCPMRSTKAYS